MCQDIVKEIRKYDTDPYKYFARFAGEHSVTGRKYDIDIGYERFLAPEIFFNPEIYSSDFLTPLPEVVDNVIQTSPIDVRRGLYKVGWEVVFPVLLQLTSFPPRTSSFLVVPPCSRTLEGGCSETSSTSLMEG